MSETREMETYIEALRRIAEACAKPFGKDARAAKRIATESLRTWGRSVK